MDQRTTAPKETRDAAIRRLAVTALERGVQVYCYENGPTVTYYATSVSRPGTLHRVTMVSCDCLGFVTHHRCVHHAALLAEIGELPEPDPDGAAALAARYAEVGEARAELCRLEDLNRRHKLKSTADWANLARARERVAALAAELAVLDPVPSPAAVAALAA